MTEYQVLANEIIIQAARDYRNALRRLKRIPNDEHAVKTKIECEAFFRSDWYGVLTEVDGELIIEKIKAEVADGSKRISGKSKKTGKASAGKNTAA